MLTALLIMATFFGIVQEVKIPGRIKFISFRTRKQGDKRSALVTVPNKQKS